MRKIFRALRKARFSYEPLIEVRLFSGALLHNIRTIQTAHPTLGVAPVLKSNAYGHGLVHIASLLDTLDLPFFVVDSYYEALILRNEGMRTPLLIVGYTPVATIEHSRLPNVAFMMTSMDQLRGLAFAARKTVSIHLKIDTGMHRQGIVRSDLDEALEIIAKYPHILLEGVATHFADADGDDAGYTLSQIASWNECAAMVRSRFPSVTFFHCAASAGAVFDAQCDANVLRAGIALYGIHCGSEKLDLKPVLELRTSVSALKQVRAGEYIGYNCTYRAQSDMMIAIIPIGYAEGLDRRLSSRGSVLVRGVPCPLVGRVSMNIAAADVSDCSGVQYGDEVIVYSVRSEDLNSIEKSAALCGTISHELLVHISPQLRRTIV